MPGKKRGKRHFLFVNERGNLVIEVPGLDPQNPSRNVDVEIRPVSRKSGEELRQVILFDQRSRKTVDKLTNAGQSMGEEVETRRIGKNIPPEVNPYRIKRRRSVLEEHSLEKTMDYLSLILRKGIGPGLKLECAVAVAKIGGEKRVVGRYLYRVSTGAHNIVWDGPLAVAPEAQGFGIRDALLAFRERTHPEAKLLLEPVPPEEQTTKRALEARGKLAREHGYKKLSYMEERTEADLDRVKRGVRKIVAGEKVRWYSKDRKNVETEKEMETVRKIKRVQGRGVVPKRLGSERKRTKRK